MSEQAEKAVDSNAYFDWTARFDDGSYCIGTAEWIFSRVESMRSRGVACIELVPVRESRSPKEWQVLVAALMLGLAPVVILWLSEALR